MCDLDGGSDFEMDSGLDINSDTSEDTGFDEGISDSLESSVLDEMSDVPSELCETDNTESDFADLEDVPFEETQAESEAPLIQVEDASLGSDFQAENNAIYEQFKDDYESGNIELVQPEECDTKEVNAQDIVGTRYDDTVSEEEFWAHHGNSKEDFVELVSKVPEVKNQLEEGKTLDEIKTDETLRATAEQYFDENNMIRVYEDGEKYIFDGDGRHRVTIAQEYGQDIPVKIIREVKDK